MSVQSDDPSTHTPEQAEPPIDGAQPGSADDLETLRAELAEIEQKADEYLRLAQRTQADFINYRRRVDDERAQQAREANIAYIQQLTSSSQRGPTSSDFPPRGPIRGSRWRRGRQDQVASGKSVDNAERQRIGRFLRLTGRFAQTGVGGREISGGEGVTGAQHRLIDGSELQAEHALRQQWIGAGQQPVNLAAESVKIRRHLRPIAARGERDERACLCPQPVGQTVAQLNPPPVGELLAALIATRASCVAQRRP